MAYTTINKSTDYFNTVTYSGNSSTNNITGVGFQPDWLWIKARNYAENHVVYDAIRGVTKQLYPNTTGAESTNATALTAFGTDGFNLATANGNTNANGTNFVSWNWKAANSSGSSNSDGSITSTVSANTTAGFSIIKYTGTGATATVGHGLGAIPDMMIIKRYSDSGEQWTIYHKSLGNTKHILFTSGSSTTQTNYWNDTSPTSSYWTMGNQSEVNGSGTTNICYAFASKTGYSKFGGYIGNDNANGPFVYTGFKPSFVLFKRTAGSAANWQLWDNKRDPINPVEKALHPDIANVASTDQDIDFLSNGFKIRSDQAHLNNGGTLFVYMAFGQSIVGSNNIAATAR